MLFVVRREPDGKGRAGKGGPQAVFTGDAVFIGCVSVGVSVGVVRVQHA